jgi:hypothetical protein
VGHFPQKKMKCPIFFNPEKIHVPKEPRNGNQSPKKPELNHSYLTKIIIIIIIINK